MDKRLGNIDYSRQFVREGVQCLHHARYESNIERAIGKWSLKKVTENGHYRKWSLLKWSLLKMVTSENGHYRKWSLLKMVVTSSSGVCFSAVPTMKRLLDAVRATGGMFRPTVSFRPLVRCCSSSAVAGTHESSLRYVLR
jgi:hypothetical protein